MPKIDHEERKRHIIAESIKLFAKYGYGAVNFGMIAKNVGVARTLLYTYFDNKRQIFNAAIDGVTHQVETKYAEVVHSRQSADAKLRQICITVFAMLFDNRDFVCVISDVLSHERRKGAIPVEKVDEHTVGVKRVLKALVREAIRRGEYRQNVNPGRVVSVLYALFEAMALRITTTGRPVLSECINQLDSIVTPLRK